MCVKRRNPNANRSVIRTVEVSNATTVGATHTEAGGTTCTEVTRDLAVDKSTPKSTQNPPAAPKVVASKSAIKTKQDQKERTTEESNERRQKIIDAAARAAAVRQ
ncbi:hypothetical protein M3Y98_00684400 [Aphelenchoides besseyi]|nr:hypothetical protein M3Y98_00684400 [Aphelenchoides besseyi]KAI6209055.1 hypothetical protein M3Y96_00180500 [Aphelenchoides besseyi]